MPTSVSAPVMMLSLIVRLEALKMQHRRSMSTVAQGPPNPATDHRVAGECAACAAGPDAAPRSAQLIAGGSTSPGPMVLPDTCTVAGRAC